MVFAAFCCLSRQMQIVPIELDKAAAERHIAGADFAGAVFDDGVDRDSIVSQQLAAHRQGIEFPYLTGCPANAPAQQHVELETALAAHIDQWRYVQRFENCHHGVGRVHPQVIGCGAGGGAGIDNSRLHTMRSSSSGFPD